MATAQNKGIITDGLERIHYSWPLPWILADVIESTAIIVERRGQFRKCIMVYKDHDFDSDWNIVSRPGAKSKGVIGGLHNVGWRFLDKAKQYNLRWKTSQLAEGPGEVEFYEKTLYYFMLRPGVYYTKVDKAETGPSTVSVFVGGTTSEITERVPLTLELLITATIVNPYKFAYDAPQNPIEKMSDLINAVVANWVGTKSYDEIINLRKAGKDAFWVAINGEPIFDTIKNKYGWEINLIHLKNLISPPEIEEAGMKRVKTEMEMNADVLKTGTRWLKMVSIQTGLKEEEIRTMVKDKSDEFQKKYGAIAERCWDMVKRQIEIEGKARFHLEVEGGSGPETWIALLKMLGGAVSGKGNQSGERGKNQEKNKSSSSKNESDDERRKRYVNKYNRVIKGKGGPEANKEDEEDEEE